MAAIAVGGAASRHSEKMVAANSDHQAMFNRE